MPTTPSPQITLAASSTDTPTPAPVTPRLVGYYTGWGAGRYPVADIPADQLTHVIYAFANVSAAGECVSENTKQDDANWPALAQLKHAHPSLGVLISVGGWSQSGLFSDVAATATARAHFAESCAAFVQAHGLGGVMFWELSLDDAQHSLVNALHSHLYP